METAHVIYHIITDVDQSDVGSTIAYVDNYGNSRSAEMEFIDSEVVGLRYADGDGIELSRDDLFRPIHQHNNDDPEGSITEPWERLILTTDPIIEPINKQ